MVLCLTLCMVSGLGQQSEPPKPMAADADPSFEVATIKPGSGDGKPKYFRIVGRTYQTHNTALADLIEISYGVHPRQIVGAPAWVFEDKFDLVATPDGEGQPNGRQWLRMIQKMMEDRFQLKLHHETQAISVYVLSLAKGGPLGMTASQSTSQFPSLEFSPIAGGLVLPARNTTMASFCQMMQQVVLDRPVVDHSGITGRFDFALRFAPDDSEFDGHPRATLPLTDRGSAPPGLFEAMEKQLGLKLNAEKAATDVLVIDRAVKPSAN